jgi:hypothetical protein
VQLPGSRNKTYRISFDLHTGALLVSPFEKAR